MPPPSTSHTPLVTHGSLAFFFFFFFFVSSFFCPPRELAGGARSRGSPLPRGGHGAHATPPRTPNLALSGHNMVQKCVIPLGSCLKNAPLGLCRLPLVQKSCNSSWVHGGYSLSSTPHLPCTGSGRAGGVADLHKNGPPLPPRLATGGELCLLP